MPEKQKEAKKVLNFKEKKKISLFSVGINLFLSLVKVAGRNAGSFKFVQLDLRLHTDSLTEAHNLSHEIEKKIKGEMPFVEKVVVHYQ